MNFFDWSDFTAAINDSCTQLDREVRGKNSKCQILEMCCSRPKFFCAWMLTLYMVTINPGLVHLGPLIREYLCHLRPKIFTPPIPVGCRLNLFL